MHGTLNIRYPDGSEARVDIDREELTIGRSANCDAILDHRSVSRRHARLLVRDRTIYIEDLDSDNGTSVGDSRLVPGSRYRLTGGERLRFGSVEAVLEVAEALAEPAKAPPPEAAAVPQPGQAAAATEAATPAQPPTAALVATSLELPDAPVAPGAGATAVLTVHNRGEIVDEFSIDVQGLSPDWVSPQRPTLTIYPGQQAKVSLQLAPPRRPESRAGDNPFTVTVTSREQAGAKSVASGVLQVLPFDDLRLSLAPQQARRKFAVRLENLGNRPHTCQLRAEDPEQGLSYSLPQPLVTVIPGQVLEVPLEVRTTRQVQTAMSPMKPFTVTAAPQTPGVEPIVASGMLLVSQPWWRRLLALLTGRVLLVILPVLLIAAALVYQMTCQKYGLPGCFVQRPVVNHFSLRTETGDEFMAGDTALVQAGSQVVLSWLVENADTVEISPVPGTQSVDPQGTLTLRPEEPVLLTLAARGTRGSVEQSLQLEVEGASPVVQSFSAEPASLVQGDVPEIELSWEVAGGDSIEIMGVGGGFAAADSVMVEAPANSKTFRLTAGNAYGQSAAETFVEVIAPTPTATETTEATVTATTEATVTATPDDGSGADSVLPDGVIDGAMFVGLKPPKPLSPPDGQVLTDESRKVTLRWSIVDGARGYRLEVDYGSGTTWLPVVRSETRDTRYTYVHEGDAPLGRWRVQSLDTRSRGGFWTEWQTLRYSR